MLDIVMRYALAMVAGLEILVVILFVALVVSLGVHVLKGGKLSP